MERVAMEEEKAGGFRSRWDGGRRIRTVRNETGEWTQGCPPAEQFCVRHFPHTSHGLTAREAEVEVGETFWLGSPLGLSGDTFKQSLLVKFLEAWDRSSEGEGFLVLEFGLCFVPLFFHFLPAGHSSPKVPRDKHF